MVHCSNARVEDLNVMVVASTPEQFATHIKMAKARQLIEAANDKQNDAHRASQR
jgi:hypothetical protein